MYTRIFDALNYRKMLNWLPDKVFLKAAFRARFGRKLDLNVIGKPPVPTLNP